MKKLTYRHIILTTLSIFALTIFVNFGTNKDFLFGRVFSNWEKMEVLHFCSDSTLRVARWGKPYYAAIQIKKMCIDSNMHNPVILLEPNGYYKAKKMDFSTIEPVTFYYFTGIEAIWMNSENIKRATHLMVVNDDMLSLQPIIDSTHLASIIEFYKPYKVTL